MAKYLDYEQAALQAGISPGDLQRVRERVERDYPSPTLRALRLVAICKAIGRAEMTVDDALAPPSILPPPPSDLRMGG